MYIKILKKHTNFRFHIYISEKMKMFNNKQHRNFISFSYFFTYNSIYTYFISHNSIYMFICRVILFWSFNISFLFQFSYSPQVAMLRLNKTSIWLSFKTSNKRYWTYVDITHKTIKYKSFSLLQHISSVSK